MPKKFPVLSTKRQTRTVFDSADHFMEKEQERKQNIESTPEVEMVVPEAYKNKAPVLPSGRTRKTTTTFDSAEYFMKQDQERRRAEAQPASENQPAVENQSEIEIPASPEGKAPVLKKGRTRKTTTKFDSAEYFMNQAKLNNKPQ